MDPVLSGATEEENGGGRVESPMMNDSRQLCEVSNARPRFLAFGPNCLVQHSQSKVKRAPTTPSEDNGARLGS